MVSRGSDHFAAVEIRYAFAQELILLMIVIGRLACDTDIGEIGAVIFCVTQSFTHKDITDFTV